MTQFCHSPLLSRITRQRSLSILRTKIPEAVEFKDRVWSLMTRKLLLTFYFMCTKKKKKGYADKPGFSQTLFKVLWNVTVLAIRWQLLKPHTDLQPLICSSKCKARNGSLSSIRAVIALN